MKSEFELIERLKQLLPPISSQVELGIGDDAATVHWNEKRILTTVDSLVEGIHFDWKFCRPSEVGKKAMNANLSDIAAMGGKPRFALIALGLPISWDQEKIEGMYRGIAEVCGERGVDVVGGNISRNPERLWISITVLGDPANGVLKRSGAQVGDVIFLSGTVGEAAAGLELLRSQPERARQQFPNLVRRYTEGHAQIELGQLLGKKPKVHSLIDVSDGLSSELWHLSKASQVEVVIQANQLWVSEELQRASVIFSQSPLRWQLSGGEDYELLGTCSSESWKVLHQECESLKIPIRVIGEVARAGAGVYLKNESGHLEPLPALGWNHLST
ncbi:thiamine-phosphate kinase [bacterium]|nr:thiamine-phosphate kinase [bacterium]